jgi:hypothetical protein
VVGLLPAAAPLWLLSALMALVGLGGPTVSPPATAVLLDTVPHHQAGVASGVFNTSRQVGGALAVAVFGGLPDQPRHLRARGACEPADRRRRHGADRRPDPVPAAHHPTARGASMTDLTPTDPGEVLDLFGSAEQIEISTRRVGGTLRGFVPIWAVARRRRPVRAVVPWR